MPFTTPSGRHLISRYTECYACGYRYYQHHGGECPPEFNEQVKPVDGDSFDDAIAGWLDDANAENEEESE